MVDRIQYEKKSTKDEKMWRVNTNSKIIALTTINKFRDSNRLKKKIAKSKTIEWDKLFLQNNFFENFPNF